MAITALVTRGFTFETGVELDPAGLNQLGEPTVTIPSITETSVTLENYTVSEVPSNGDAGRVVYVSNGDSGNPCLAVDDGTSWLRVSLGSAISAE